MKNPYNPKTEPASYKWFEEKPVEAKEKKEALFTNEEILDEMGSDLIDEDLEAGHVHSLVYEHWRNKYLIVRR